MTATASLPQPVARDGEHGPVDPEAFEADLRSELRGEVRLDSGSRAAYATDASNFRQPPTAVVVPADVEDAVAAVTVCRRHDAPVFSRGGGTSLSGQCCNTGVVLDWSKYCTSVVSVDPDGRTCVVEPGIVLDVLNGHLADHGLEFGPSPATHYNCTIGGMIGNNSCGATAQRTGKVVDNISRMEVLLYDGTRFWCGATSDEEYAEIASGDDRRAEIYRQLRALRDAYLGEIRTGYPNIPRRVSGYNLDSLLPEKGFDVARALVGSESTLVTVLRAELQLVPTVTERATVVLGYPSVTEAARNVPAVLEHEPIALEAIDRRLVDFEREKGMNSRALELLPEGEGYLIVQFGGDTADDARSVAEGLASATAQTQPAPTAEIFDDPDRAEEIWTVRESGLGATAHVPGRPSTWPGWEDSAVAPERLADYLSDLRGLYREYGYESASLYGHFGQGCVHTRIPFDLLTAHGVEHYRGFLERAADLVVSHGGSLSGEHGDGQQRGELLTRMFGEDLVTAFAQTKAIFDPEGKMNPGKVVDARPLDEDLRLGTEWAPKDPGRTHFPYAEDDHSFAKATMRCVGVGKCRQHTSENGTVMCPSFMVLHEEEHSTRGRARLLFEMLDGHGTGPVKDLWRSREVHDALDLCLSCKGCKSDCPVGVDMASYKAEFLAHFYKGRLRPRSAYALGFLPLAAAAVTGLRLGPLLNAVTGLRPLRSLLASVAGVADREVPRFAERSLQHWWRARRPTRGRARAPGAADGVTGASGAGSRGTVMLWPDTFTNRFEPDIGRAAVAVLERAGWEVVLPEKPVCCGLTWVSTGQLDVAKRVMRRTVAQLRQHLRAGGLVVGVEPSCTAALRSDVPGLLGEDQDAQRLAEQTVTFAQLLADHTPGWEPPDVDRDAVVQVHCHQHAELGFDAETDLMERAGIRAEHLDSGCCGLAGNFGYEPGHLDVSVACAERVMLPRIRETDDEMLVLADGFSCRTQIDQLDSGGRHGRHLAQVLADAYGAGTP
jgi:FAD/FMN-containing dehydrogenase/Fe-S oxidoreductase